MKMNTKSRMAIAAILDVAVNGTYKPVALAGVAERQDISLSYLEQLFRKLREQGYVLSARGPGGGYRLNRRLADISVADIVAAVDHEPLDGGACAGAGSCQDGHGFHAGPPVRGETCAHAGRTQPRPDVRRRAQPTDV